METLKHECGVALIKLRKPTKYYTEKYGTPRYALNKLYLLMQKQHNRGQEGAGVACVNLQAEAGEEFMFRERQEGKNAITELFQNIGKEIEKLPKEGKHDPFIGECYMGHLRYSTTGRSGVTYVHPHLRRNNYRRNTFALCGNFNLTNVDEVFEHLKAQGQHPRRTSDTTILLEQLGFYIDKHDSDTEAVLRDSMPLWDGGYVICGMTGDGEMFAARDRWGIRSAFYYIDDEIIVIASERPAIQTVMNLPQESITELNPGESIILKRDGSIKLTQIAECKESTPCSFERIYFSRGNDADIYRERKELGRRIVPAVLGAIGGDIVNTVFSFIPNTAETAFLGLNERMNEQLSQEKYEAILQLPEITKESIEAITSQRVRFEKVAVKDIKLRTFISESGERNELANHVYDITYGSLIPNQDNLAIIDDSIVRGTTLRNSIITILSRLNPKKLVIISSAPQIRYPDFYGIDMANIAELIAFKAAISLSTREAVESVYRECIAQRGLDGSEMVNHIKELYAPYTNEQISAEIARLVTPKEVKCEVELIFQTNETLREICPNNAGDWYFSGNYPTPGGMKCLNESFIKYYESL